MKRWTACVGLVLVALALLIPSLLIHVHTEQSIFGSHHPTILALVAWALMWTLIVLGAIAALVIVVDWCWEHK